MNIPKKVITIDTNFNHKLGCDHMVHVDLAPSKGIPECVAKQTIIEIKTKDNSHPPVQYQLDDLARFPLIKTPAPWTQLSHAMDPGNYIAWFNEKYKNINPTTELAAYFYKKYIPE